MRLTLTLGLLMASSSVMAGDNVMLVLDASGSMWGQIDGKSKVEIARTTVASVLNNWNAEDQLGLIAYGHRKKGDCEDIETLIPVGPLDTENYLSVVNKLNAVGMTPLTAAVQQAATALRSSEQKATVILVSDGEETCNLDPCSVGEELEKSGVDFTAHVIGFDIKDIAQQAQLKCLAESTGGRYYSAGDAQELTAALRGAVEANEKSTLPPVTATISLDGAAKISNPIIVNWQGPGEQGDYISIAHTDQPNNKYISYVSIYDPEIKSGQASILAPATAGDYEVRYVSASRDDQVLARQIIEVIEQEASLDAASQVEVSSLVKVVARGPHGDRDWVGFAEVSAPIGQYLEWRRLTGAESELEIRAPAKPGSYELRYVLNESERIITSLPIEVVDVEVKVSGPNNVMAGDVYAFEAQGPEDRRHWIGFAPVGSDASAYRDFVRPNGTQSSGVLTAPTKPGAYELRYVLNESERIAAAQKVTVEPPVATLEFSNSIGAGEKLTIQFTGPRGKGTAIGFVKRGSTDWEHYDDELSMSNNLIMLTAPSLPGEYDIAYEFDQGILLRKPITVH